MRLCNDGKTMTVIQYQASKLTAEEIRDLFDYFIADVERVDSELEQFLSDFPLEQSSVLPPAPPETPLIAKGRAEIMLTSEQLAWLKERGK